MAKELVFRKDVPMEMTWDLTKIYETKQEMDKDIHTIEILRDEILNTYKGKLDTPKQINKCLDQFRKLNELVVLACNYTELAVSVDYYNIEDQEAYGRVNRIVSEVFSDLSFIESEISEQKEQIIQEAIKLTEKNKGYLKDILRNKPHRLHSEAEKVLTAISQTTESPYEVYNAAKLADMQFDSSHYYMGLYSYTYSAGLTIATQMCKRIEKEGESAIKDWMKVLEAGSTKAPVELAKMAGIDITTDEALMDTIDTIGAMIDEICELTQVIN